MTARRGFMTRIGGVHTRGAPPPAPPSELFDLVDYPSPVGPLHAYVTPRPKDGLRRAAVIWLQGGLDNAINSESWTDAGPDNDQSGRAFREAGAVLMVPSLRGGNDNPGRRETLFGEVDDVLSAAQWLSERDYVDPSRIFLVGHSSGGTLALLVAESTDRFRAVLAFGPTADVASYGKNILFDRSDEQELRLRSPLSFLGAIKSQTFVLEGRDKPGNLDSAEAIEREASAARAPLEAVLVPDQNHFSILAAVTPLVARKIVATAPFSLNEAEVLAATKQR